MAMEISDQLCTQRGTKSHSNARGDAVLDSTKQNEIIRYFGYHRSFIVSQKIQHFFRKNKTRNIVAASTTSPSLSPLLRTQGASRGAVRRRPNPKRVGLVRNQ